MMLHTRFPSPFLNRATPIFGLLLAISSLIAQPARADYPKPSPYPVSWQLKFDHSAPQRIVIQPAGAPAPVAYWYVTYTVTNSTDSEQTFLPIFEMLTNGGQVIRSDKNIPASVFAAIKARERKELLEPFTKIGGELRLGEDQAKDGVAIWKEPMPRMGKFSIFIQGLSGEALVLKDDKGANLKDKDGQTVILRKTLQLNYFIRGDEVYPGEDEVNEDKEAWVMR